MDNQQVHPEGEARILARGSRRKGKCKDRSKDKPPEARMPAQPLPGRQITPISRYGSYKSITLQDGSASVSTARYGNTRGSDRYSFDPETGQITRIQLYKDLPKNGKIRGWIYSVHTGSWGGLATRILSCIAALLGGILALTGYYFWFRKMRLKKRRTLAESSGKRSFTEKA